MSASFLSTLRAGPPPPRIALLPDALFFTRAVNELTPTGSQSVVGGFFYGRDLFPKQDSPQLGSGSGCPSSNVAEMFYLLVPDPNGVVNGNVRTKNFVSHLTVSTTARA